MNDMNIKKTKLNYKYEDQPYTYNNDPHIWGQVLNFKIELARFGKKRLLKDRANLVRDVAKLFSKYGIDTDLFNTLNEYI